MEPEEIYFVLIVAFCVVAVLLLVWRAENKNSTRLKARKKLLQKKARLRQKRAESAHHKSVLGHTASRHAHRVDVWEAQRRRAGEEIRDGSSFRASRLYSDKEKAKDDSDQDLAMSAIEYTPEEPPKRSRTGR